jgi:molybdate transport system substrate-binding protein
MRALVALFGALFAGSAHAAEITILSGGAVEPGLMAAVETYRQQGHVVSVSFATAPMIRQRIEAGTIVDVVIAPPAVTDQLGARGLLSDVKQIIGRVGVGVAVRAGAERPAIGDPQAFEDSVTSADSLVFNQASTGIYLDGLFQKMGLAERIKPKSTRYPDGAAVMEHVIAGKGAGTGTGNEIGFGAITEILLYKDKGLVFVGPLPPALQNYTRYVAAVMKNAPNAKEANALVAFLASADGKAAFASGGVEGE